MKEELFELILSKHPETLNQNFISIDLLPNWEYEYSPNSSNLLDTDIFTFIRSGYICEVRECRYLTILVSEWSKIKLNIQEYNRENRINKIIDAK